MLRFCATCAILTKLSIFLSIFHLVGIGPLLVGPLLVGPLLVGPLLVGPLLVGPLFFLYTRPFYTWPILSSVHSALAYLIPLCTAHWPILSHSAQRTGLYYPAFFPVGAYIIQHFFP